MEGQSVIIPIRKDQDSRGALINGALEQNNQDSQGALIKIQRGDFRTTHENIEELEVDSIQPCSEVPDFLEPTISKNPIVVKTPGSIICIDGWELIEKARFEKKIPILCHVHHCSDCSPLELAIRKTAIRTLPQGGKCSYAELIRNVTILERMLMNSMGNPVKYSHGGTRRGINYTDNRENNIRNVLAERLGKSVTTINKYLSHAEYLTDEAINAFVKNREGKKFFEEAQSNKRITAKNLRRNDVSDEAITAEISERMQSWLEEFHENKEKIKPVIYDGLSANGDGGDPSVEKRTCKLDLARDFKHMIIDMDPDHNSQPSQEEINKELKRIGIAVLNLGKKPRPWNELINEVQRQMSDYALLLQRMIYLHKLEQQTSRDKEEI